MIRMISAELEDAAEALEQAVRDAGHDGHDVRDAKELLSMLDADEYCSEEGLLLDMREAANRLALGAV